MAVYAVGDIQGCFKPLKKLLKKVEFDPAVDTLWCVGDLVNRGPDSLETLRYLKGLGDACICILGNHDLHLLELAAGGRSFRGDTFSEVTRAEDFDALIEWLRFRPMIHTDQTLGWAMVHAGLHPKWTLEKASKKARKIEEKLRGEDWKTFCLQLQSYHLPPGNPKDKLEKQLFATAVMTRTRYCNKDGLFDWQNISNYSAKVLEKPWFRHNKLAWRGDIRIVFGHWAAKGLVDDQAHVLGLDSGCVWGGRMTLAQLDSNKPKLISISCPACQSIR